MCSGIQEGGSFILIYYLMGTHKKAGWGGDTRLYTPVNSYIISRLDSHLTAIYQDD